MQKEEYYQGQNIRNNVHMATEYWSLRLGLQGLDPSQATCLTLPMRTDFGQLNQSVRGMMKRYLSTNTVERQII